MTMHGSLQNRMMEVQGEQAINVGDGATLLMYTDCHACTVIEVLHFKSGPKKGQVKGVVVQSDTATPTPEYDYFSNQSYLFTPNPNGEKDTVTRCKNGKWTGRNGNYGLGFRREYRDPHF